MWALRRAAVGGACALGPRGCLLHSLPHTAVHVLQVSQLTALRILYLHRCFADPDTRVETRDWEALRPLTSLAFLSISGNKLAQLPPVVAGMSHLQV